MTKKDNEDFENSAKCWICDNSFYNCQSPIDIKYITKIRLGLIHLREHKFKHSFQGLINPIYNCGNDVESAIHFFLHCPLYSNKRCTILNS